MHRRIAPSLYGGAGILAVAGLTLLVLPPQEVRPRDGPLPVEVPNRTRTPSENAAALLSYEAIVRDNVFAPNRTAPANRYTPPGRSPDRASPAPPTPRSAPPLRLFGLANGPTGSVALIDADPSIPGAEIYRPGDQVARYRLESIADSFVVLAGTDGTSMILRLNAPMGRSP